MKSTSTTTNENVLFKERESITDYLKLIRQERIIQQAISKNPFRSRLAKILAAKEVFKLNQEIAAKERYLAEIQKNIDAFKGTIVNN